MQKTLLVLALLIPGVLHAQAPVSKLGSGSVEERLAQLERVMDARNAAQMALLDQMGQLQDEVANLRGTTEEHAYQIEQILQRQREIYQEIDRRLATNPQPVPVASDTNATANSGASASYSSNLSENEAYEQAIQLVLRDKRYDAAVPAFNAFIENFPQSSYVPNAHYWLGQLLFAESNYDQAKVHFATVMNDFKDSNKRGDCILKLGIIAQQQDDTAAARQYYNQVMQEYPSSTEAGLAKKRLDNL
ncbi:MULTISPECIES: tol-pal system protein YbgF [Idiomarina]|uniref:tol-pal system protein YbgF n=1 Tax=Idiomarina TaxID=135575 RepID=UPI00129B6592|nr:MULTISPECIES: tol-pal system protein YbgF [Idiomarina]MRJ41211.1 tol-pal system protein YbgF [Idiomarina sp. FeN1]NCU56376.1 tol-pal system protein YbgF [Idiomarina sp. FenA--70]NCU59395.1 tol-pal system protein YbgF [Idiomarina sp. FenBw--71]UUN12570.1 tol-pal system protein YbgF [Idiomarina loihiensis]